MKYQQNNPENSREYKAGEVVDCAPDHAHRWIRRNAAVEFIPAKDDVPEAVVLKKSKPSVEAMVPAAPSKG